MEVTKDFILSEIADLESELQRAKTFVIQAQAAIDTHRTILNRLESEGIEQSPSAQEEEKCQ